MKRAVLVILLVAAIWPAAAAPAQDASGDRVVVNFSDPSRTGLLRVNVFNGELSVRTHTGKDVIIESRSRGNRNPRPAPPPPTGLRRIDINGSGLGVEESNNVISVNRGVMGNGDLDILVPAKTNLNLRGMNGRLILVDGVDGDIEVTNQNGDVQLNNVSGSVVAHSANGKVIASMRELPTDKPLSFSSMNGIVDVTLPAAVKATLKIRSDNGSTYSDFDILLRLNSPTGNDRNRRGFQAERLGTINGGGPDVDLRSFNGNIYIRKGK